jgi:hypothetical protein
MCICRGCRGLLAELLRLDLHHQVMEIAEYDFILMFYGSGPLGFAGVAIHEAHRSILRCHFDPRIGQPDGDAVGVKMRREILPFVAAKVHHAHARIVDQYARQAAV